MSKKSKTVSFKIGQTASKGVTIVARSSGKIAYNTGSGIANISRNFVEGLSQGWFPEEKKSKQRKQPVLTRKQWEKLEAKKAAKAAKKAAKAEAKTSDEKTVEAFSQS